MPKARIPPMEKSVGARALLALFFCSALGAHAADKKPAPGPELRSANALIVDANSGDVIYERDSGKAVPIASITKLMTALVVLDGQQRLDEVITITADDKWKRKGAFSRLPVVAH